MNFLTLAFPVFFTAVLLLYYLVPDKARNVVLVVANSVFVFWAGPSLGVWLPGAVLLSFLCGLGIERGKHRSEWLVLGVTVMFGALFVCKYLDLAVVGISFYSLSLVGYLFDVYRGKSKAEHNILRYAAAASLFPSLLSGPINRLRELLPQLERARRFDLVGFKTGLWRFLCGMGEKLVLANLVFDIIDPAYAAPESCSGAAWILVACLYALYIYVDFAAYSDMALGTAKMLGLELTENFRAPFLSRTVKELWRKWHISLTSWFREYLYIPLGGSRKGRLRTWGNILLVFAVSGLWHGASATFLVWGLLNGLYQVVGDMTLSVRRRVRRALHIPEDAWYTALINGLVTFALFSVSTVFFRATSLEQAGRIFGQILRFGAGEAKFMADLWPGKRRIVVLTFSLVLLGVKDVSTAQGRELRLPRTTFRFWLTAALLVAAVLLFGRYGPGFQGQDFVYFDF